MKQTPTQKHLQPVWYFPLKRWLKTRKYYTVSSARFWIEDKTIYDGEDFTVHMKNPTSKKSSILMIHWILQNCSRTLLLYQSTTKNFKNWDLSLILPHTIPWHTALLVFRVTKSDITIVIDLLLLEKSKIINFELDLDGTYQEKIQIFKFKKCKLPMTNELW